MYKTNKTKIKITYYILLVLIMIFIVRNTPVTEAMATMIVLSTLLVATNIENFVLLRKFIRQNAEDAKLRKDIIKKKSKITAILNNLPIMTFLQDSEGRYIRGNRKFAETFKCPEEEAPREAMAHLIKYHTEESIEEERRVLDTLSSVNYVRKLAILDNPPTWYRINRSPILNENGELFGMVTTMDDIEAEMDIAKQKETYIATLTHDLKVPTLAQIRSLELLLNGSLGELTPEQKEISQLTLDSCNYMLDMISTILSTYRYEDNGIELDHTEFDIVELTTEVCKEVDYFARDKHIVVIIKPHLGSGIIRADKMQIKRVIMNLLSNSIAYAKENSNVLIEIIQNSNGMTEYLIKNTSTYIPPAVMKDLFSKYVTHKSKYNKVGIGLGLYLSRQIIEKHGGSMIAQSNPKDENIFGFKLDNKIPAATLAKKH